MTILAPILAQVPTDPSMEGWFGVAQKVGAGATFVMGIVLFFLWRAYQEKDRQLIAETAYQKERDKQTLAVMIELTTLIKGIDERDKKSTQDDQTSTSEILKAIAELKGLVREHFIASRTASINANAA